MGEARQRGTLEQRVEQATSRIERKAQLEREARAEKDAQESRARSKVIAALLQSSIANAPPPKPLT